LDSSKLLITLDSTSTTRPLELLHMDLFDPSRTMSLGGNYYAFEIVDDFSRLTWTLFFDKKVIHFLH